MVKLNDVSVDTMKIIRLGYTNYLQSTVNRSYCFFTSVS